MKTDLNPMLAARVEPIVEQLIQTRDLIREPIEKAKLAVEELQQYIEFEIAKIELASETEPVDATLRARLRHAKHLRDDFPANSLLDTLNTIQDLKSALWIWTPDHLEGTYDPETDPDNLRDCTEDTNGTPTPHGRSRRGIRHVRP